MNANKPIRVLLADDHTIYRNGITTILGDSKAIEFIGEAATEKMLFDALDKRETDVLLLGFSTDHAISTLEKLNELKPNLKKVILSMSIDRSAIRSLLQSGIHGYLLKSATPKELVSTIKSIAEGSVCLSAGVIESILSSENELIDLDLKKIPLTGRQIEVLKLVAIGLTNRQIAEVLQISPRTVDTHRRHIMEKLDLHNAAALSHYAAKHGIMD